VKYELTKGIISCPSGTTYDVKSVNTIPRRANGRFIAHKKSHNRIYKHETPKRTYKRPKYRIDTMQLVKYGLVALSFIILWRMG